MHTVDTSPSNVGPFARLDMHNVCPFRTASGARIVSARSENLERVISLKLDLALAWRDSHQKIHSISKPVDAWSS